jgi:hypothetical protein
MGTYLVEVRITGPSRRECTELIDDVAERFDVTPGDGYRREPHIPLYGPFETDNIAGAIHAVERVCTNFDLVPYEMAGLGHVRDQALYATIAPTRQLRDLRSKLSSALLAVSRSTVPKRDRSDIYRFLLPIATDIGQSFPAVWDFCADRAPRRKEYALRITLREGNDIVREYDLLLDRPLSAEEALDDELFATTREALADRRSPNDHTGLVSNDPAAHRQGAKRALYRTRERWRERTHTALEGYLRPAARRTATETQAGLQRLDEETQASLQRLDRETEAGLKRLDEETREPRATLAARATEGASELVERIDEQITKLRKRRDA